MTNILTLDEAANALRTDTDDVVMLDLLPLVDRYVENATGRDWSADSTIYPEAKSAARMLLVTWYENPGMIGSVSALQFGLAAALTQLEAKALILESNGVPEEELELEASMPADGADEVAVSVSIVLIFNHEMAAAATSAVTLADSAGNSVAVTNSLDATGKILTVNPDSDLSADTSYVVTITTAADAYGMTLTDDIQFRTA